MRVILPGLFLVAAAVHCGGTTGKPSTTTEAGTSREAGVTTEAGPAPGSVVGECGVGNSCPAGSTCYHPIGSCGSKPKCVEDQPASSGTCKSEFQVCGCDAGLGYSGCAFPSGYASIPSTGPCTASVPEAGATVPLTSCSSPQPSSIRTSGTPCSPPCKSGEICEVGAPPDIGCNPDSGVSCAAPPGSCTPMPSGCTSGNECNCLLAMFCQDPNFNLDGSISDGGFYGFIGQLDGGSYVINCENDP